jgi:hypothetical protein
MYLFFVLNPSSCCMYLIIEIYLDHVVLYEN